MRETKEDWLELGRDLTRRGLPAPRLIVADGAAWAALGDQADPDTIDQQVTAGQTQTTGT